MKGTRAAQRYAKAILSLAKDKNAAEAVNKDMQDISKTIAGSADLKEMLGSPVMKSGVKKKVLLEIFKNAHGITRGTFNTLLDNNRLEILELVARQYIARYNEMKEAREAVVTTAVPLSAELERKIMEKIKELTGSEAILKNVVNEDVIGGFVLRVGDLQYDASVAHNLNKLKREFKDNTYISKIQ